VAIAGSALLALAALYVPALRELLETSRLSATDVLLGLGTAVIGWAAAQLTRRMTGRQNPAREPARADALAASSDRTPAHTGMHER
jgi:hypothetical protein